MTDLATKKRNYDKTDVLERLGDMAPWMADRFGLLVGTQGRGDTQIDCPRCETGKTNKANIHRHGDGDQTFKCFRCDLKGNPFTLLVELGEAASFSEAVNLLGEELNAPTATSFTGRKPPTKQAPPKEEPRKPAVDNDRRPDEATAQREKDRYIGQRLWTPATWDKFGLESVYRNGQLAIRHPFMHNGEQWSWQDRMPNGHKNKWMSAPGVKLMPFNIDTIDALDTPLVHVCEGPADAITMVHMMRQAFPDYPAISAPGSQTWQPAWGAALAGHIVVISGDNDPAGQEFVEKVSASVAPYTRHIALLPPPDRYKDIGDWWRADDMPAEPETWQAITADVLAQLDAIDREAAAAIKGGTQ